MPDRAHPDASPEVWGRADFVTASNDDGFAKAVRLYLLNLSGAAETVPPPVKPRPNP